MILNADGLPTSRDKENGEPKNVECDFCGIITNYWEYLGENIYDLRVSSIDPANPGSPNSSGDPKDFHYCCYCSHVYIENNDLNGYVLRPIVNMFHLLERRIKQMKFKLSAFTDED